MTICISSCGSPETHPLVPESCHQLVLVRTANWETLQGTLETYEKHSDTSWKQIHGPFPVVVGTNGMGWGIGLHGKTAGEGPVKREGDGKSPAGLFRLSYAFGYDPPSEMDELSIEYRQMTANILCIDDTASSSYNCILDKRNVSVPDWTTFEYMRREDDLYRYGIVVEHNPDRVKGGGSCIFIHIWRDASHGTAGCTATSPDNLRRLMEWLSEDEFPLLVQLPDKTYRQVRRSWGLPSLD